MAEPNAKLKPRKSEDDNIDSAILRDMAALAEFTGTASFAYNDIHNVNVGTLSGYDYNRVIKGVSKCRGLSYDEAKSELIDCGVLRYLPNGEFAIDVHEATRNGGGCNYNNGLVLFNFDARKVKVLYHEYAHSLQNIYEPFNDETLRKMYDKASMNFDKAKEKDVHDYFRYLNEMHSETFAYATLLLRAKTAAEFIEYSAQALDYGASMTRNGEREWATNYSDSNANSKYYASYHVMKETIKTILKIKLANKANKYFDENGVLKYKEICDLATGIVKKSAYTPREFQAFKEHAIISRPYYRKGMIRLDHSYKKDVFDSYLFQTITRSYNRRRNDRRRLDMSSARKKHFLLNEKYINCQKAQLYSPLDTELPEHLLAIQSVDKIHAGISMIDQASGMYKNAEEILRSVVAKRYKNKDFSDSSRENDTSCLMHTLKIYDYALLKNFLTRTDEILQANANNPYFAKILSYSEHSLYQQRDAKEMLQYNPNYLTDAPEIRKDSPYFGVEDLDYVKNMISLGVNVNIKNQYGVTPLMHCVNEHKAKLLLDAGADVDAQDCYGQTALMYCKTRAMADVILSYKPNLDLRNREGETALHKCDRPIVAMAFIEAGMDVNAQDYQGKTVLMYNKSKEFVDVILNADPKPDLKIKDNDGKTVLHHCKDPEIAKMFIQQGCDVDAQDNLDNTALMLTSDKKMIQTLLEAKPNLDIRNFENENALMVNMSYDKTKLLLKAGIDVNATDNKQRNVLMIAMSLHHMNDEEKNKIINTLLKTDINIKAKDKNGNNMIVYAVNSPNMKKEEKAKLIEKFLVSGVSYKEALEKVSTEEDKALINDVVKSVRLRAQKLAEVRKKLARTVDRLDGQIGSPIQKTIGKKVEDIKLPKPIKQIEAVVSYHLFKRHNAQVKR